MVSKKKLEELPSGWTEQVNVKNGRTKTVYIEKSTGHKLYSRPQVLRYLEKVHPDSSSVKENDDVNGHNTGELTKSDHSESVEDKCHISGEKNSPGNPSLEEKENINDLDGLPHGWIKELRTRKYKDGTKQDPYYTDPVSGYVFRSKKDVWRYLETGDIGKCASKPQKRDLTELKLSGVLNSPSPANMKKEEYSASISQLFAAADMPEKDVPDIAGGCESIFPLAEGDISKEKEADCLPFDPAFRTSTVDAEEKLRYAEAVECYKSEENSMSRSEGFKQDLKLVDGNGVSSPTLTAHCRKSKRKPLSVPQRSSKRLAGHGPDASPYSKLNERTLRAAIKEEVNGSSCLSSEVAVSGGTQQLDTDLKASPEYRTSPYTEDLPDANVQVSTAARDTKSSSNKEVASEVPQQLDTDIYNEASWDINVHASVIPGNRNCVPNNAAVSEVPQQLDNLYFEASLDTDLHATIDSGDEQTGAINAAVSEVPLQSLDTLITSGASASSQSRIDMDLNCTLESCFQDMDVQQQTLVQGYETQKGLDPRFQGDYWSDPCFDFAFKTLAGGMPFEETLELDSCFQPQAEPSYTQEGGVSFVVPDMNAPAFFQNDETYNLDPVPAGISMDQLPPANPTSLPVKASLPGCSASDSQPPSKECQAEANSLNFGDTGAGKVLFW